MVDALACESFSSELIGKFWMTFVFILKRNHRDHCNKIGKVANRRKLDGRMKGGWHIALSDSRQEEHWAGHGNGVMGVQSIRWDLA